MISAAEALARLREGNRRFVMNETRSAGVVGPSERAALADRQEPFAVVLGCSDSRVPAEMVFDQGFGDLFVIRVAGNIVAPSQIGSVEFAASRFGTRLVVVMGHSRCGAVIATLEAMTDPAPGPSANLGSIIGRVRPSLETLVARGTELNSDRLLQQAVRANVRASADQLKRGSDLLEDLVGNHRLAIVGAEYSLQSGVVDFFDLPDAIADG